MTNYVWIAATTDDILVLQAVRQVAPTPKWDGSDGSYVNTSLSGGNLSVTMFVPPSIDPGAGVLNPTNLANALSPLMSAAQSAATQNTTDHGTLAAFDTAMANYIALASPTAAQTAAAVQAQARAWRYVARKLQQLGLI